MIMDLTVPGGMGGLAALRRLREIDPEVRALVTTGYSMDPVMAAASTYGFCGVIPKPWEIRELAAELRRVLGGA